METTRPAGSPEVARKPKETMGEPPKNRSVKPNGEAISRLRQQKLWRVEDLAKKAQCSVKTVENVERGANVYMFTLAKFAKALEVENSVLIAGGDVPPEPPKKERRVEVKVTFSIPFEEFDQSQQLVSLIELFNRLVQAKDAIEVKGVMAGSTIITLAMSEADVHSLISAFMAGKLDEMKCAELNLTLKHEAAIPDDEVLDLTGITPIQQIHESPGAPSVSDDVRVVGDAPKPDEAKKPEDAQVEEDVTLPKGKP
jgi:transcriptional regulator with XRE-family HTH domain